MPKTHNEEVATRYRALQSQLDGLIASIAKTQDPTAPLNVYFERVRSNPEIALAYREMQFLEKMVPIGAQKPANPR